MQLPETYFFRFREFFPDLYPAYRDSLGQPPFRGLRANTLKITPADLAEKLKDTVQLTPVPFCPEGFYIPADTAGLGNHSLHLAGGFYMQEPSAMAAVAALAPRPGERVLDLCAAPGGKSSQIAAALQGRGILVANEFVESRARVLSSNLERMGAANTLITSMRPDQLCPLLPGWFDRVLVDAPCSGEGMFRREPAAAENWSLENVKACALRQAKILDSAAAALRPGGYLVYSTCTFSPEEDEETAAAFLARHPDFYLDDIAGPWGQPGRAAFAPGCKGIEKTRRIFPFLGGEGHFVALFRRREAGDAGFPPPPPGERKKGRRPAGTNTDAALAAFSAFWEENMEGTPPGRPVGRGDKIYLLPEGCPPLEGLRLLRAGLFAGEYLRGRFVPAHALFVSPALSPRRRLDLPLDAPALAAYLRGEEIDAAGLSGGYAGVYAGGLPLGFGKASGGRLKNHYPKGLRLR